MSQTRPYIFGFLLEQTLGHRTHSQNLQTNVPKDHAVQPVWGPIEWNLTGSAAHIPIYNRNWTVRAGLRGRQIIRRMQYQTSLDALFIHTQVPAILMTDWMQRIPTVVSLDATPCQYDTLGAHYAHQRGLAWVEGLKWQANVRCFQKAHQIVAWSAWTKAGLVQEYGVPADKIVVIPPGVNSHIWTRPTPRSISGTPSDEQTNETIKILFVGGDLQRKGGNLLIEAFRTLRQEENMIETTIRSSIELHLVTRDPVAPEPGVFVYHNMEPNSTALRDLYHTCDIFCLPTYGDCLPMVLSEAGAAGLPLVATNVGGIGEIVKDGETGFLVSTGDIATLTSALRMLVENPALRLAQGTQAATLVQREFEAERNTERLLTVMKQCVTGGVRNDSRTLSPLLQKERRQASIQ
jgi:glycosyltransferase involved in cell wall biosynthesis